MIFTTEGWMKEKEKLIYPYEMGCFRQRPGLSGVQIFYTKNVIPAN